MNRPGGVVLFTEAPLDLNGVHLVLKHPITQSDLQQTKCHEEAQRAGGEYEAPWTKRWDHLLWKAPVADEQQVLQMRVEQRGVDHGDTQTLLHDEPHRAVVRETDLCRRLLKPGSAGRETFVFLSPSKQI